MEITAMLDELLKLLKEADRAVLQLSKLEEQKHEALSQVDIKKLMKINSTEEEIVQWVDLLEEKREILIESLCARLGIAPDVVLSEIAAYGNENQRRQMLELKQSIKEHSGNLDVFMRENSDLIQSNLDILNFTMNFSAVGHETYDYRSKKESQNNVYIINQLA